MFINTTARGAHRDSASDPAPGVSPNDSSSCSDRLLLAAQSPNPTRRSRNVSHCMSWDGKLEARKSLKRSSEHEGVGLDWSSPVEFDPVQVDPIPSSPVQSNTWVFRDVVFQSPLWEGMPRRVESHRQRRVRILSGSGSLGDEPRGVQARADDVVIGWHYLSNAACLIQPRLFDVLFNCSVKDHYSLPIGSSLLKNVCVRQVVLDR